MNKICTSIEQSKKLIELRINTDTSDMYYLWYSETESALHVGKSSKKLNTDCPVWSLTALLGLMPFHIIIENNRFGFYQVKGFNKQGETYRFGYKTNNDSFLFETSWYNDVVDAAFEMVCWLKRKRKI